MLGQEVATLIDHELTDEGTTEAEFDAGRLASGVYFYRIVAEAADRSTGAGLFTNVKKMILLR
jgi:hypothetical protein